MKQKRFAGVVLLVLALVATVFYLFPLVLVAINSIKTTGEFTSNPFSMPTVPQWGNYAYAFGQMHFLTSMRNSLVITVSVCVLVVSAGCHGGLCRQPGEAQVCVHRVLPDAGLHVRTRSRPT